MRLLMVLFFIIGMSCQITYSADDIYVNALDFNIVSGARYYKGIKKVIINSKGNYTDGTVVTINETRNFIGEDRKEGTTLLVSKLQSNITIGNAKPITITSYDYYNLDGSFLYSYINELNTKRVQYDKSNIIDTIQIGRKYLSSMKNTDGSIEMTETIANSYNDNIIVNSKSYMIKDDIKTISCYSKYILLKDGNVKQINIKLTYPNTTLDITSYDISIDRY